MIEQDLASFLRILDASDELDGFFVGDDVPELHATQNRKVKSAPR